jgi:SOUL heme-binding protein
MKKKFFPLCVLLASSGMLAAEPAAKVSTSGYVDEAPLPVGWPKPGPYDRVTEKSYPAYRAAFTNGKGETSAFWTLFTHIKKNDIPMTAPVEMTMADVEGDLKQAGMAFLYQNGDVGKKGADGAKVEVRDVPAAKVLSYTWQGDDTPKNISKAKRELQAALGARKIGGNGFRLLGYNGPGTPREKQTWELQALLE